MGLRVQTGVLFVKQGEGRRSQGTATIDFASWTATGDAELQERTEVGDSGGRYRSAPGVVLGLREFRIYDAAKKRTPEGGETEDRLTLTTKDWSSKRGVVEWNVDPAQSESKIIRISIAVVGEV